MIKSIVCVLRELSGQQEYVPVSEVPNLVTGERVFIGAFRSQTEKHGPYGSHERTVCTPAGSVTEGVLQSPERVDGRLVIALPVAA